MLYPAHENLPPIMRGYTWDHRFLFEVYGQPFNFTGYDLAIEILEDFDSTTTITRWTTANLTFQEAPSPDRTFQNLYDDATSPAEVSIPVSAGKNTVISTNKDKFAGMTYFKIRSGTSDNPVPQAEERTIGLLFVGV